MNIREAMLQMGTGLPSEAPTTSPKKPSSGSPGSHFRNAHKAAKSGDHKAAKAHAFKGIKALPRTAQPDADPTAAPVAC